MNFVAFLMGSVVLKCLVLVFLEFLWPFWALLFIGLFGNMFLFFGGVLSKS